MLLNRTLQSSTRRQTTNEAVGNYAYVALPMEIVQLISKAKTQLDFNLIKRNKTNKNYFSFINLKKK